MDWRTWSPFQSLDVQQICAHLTKHEKHTARLRSAFYGLWCGVSLSLPVMLIALHPGITMAIVAPVLIFTHFLFIPVWLQSQRKFLASTRWAKEHGIQASRSSLFAFGPRG